MCSSVESGSSNLATVIGVVWTCTKTIATRLLRGLWLACGVLLLCGTCVLLSMQLDASGALSEVHAVEGVVESAWKA